MLRRSSLGPFRKTHRFRDLVATCGCSPDDSDLLIQTLRKRAEGHKADPSTLKAATFLVDLVIASRETTGHGAATTPEIVGEHPAAAKALRWLIEGAQSQISIDGANPFKAHMRRFDRAGFCDLGRYFFAALLESELTKLLSENDLLVAHELLEQHAWEMSKITQSFSARWFQKCAVDNAPDAGSIRWYIGHCLGKLDMELERELTTHIEPLPNPFKRRKKVEPPSLGLGI